MNEFSKFNLSHHQYKTDHKKYWFIIFLSFVFFALILNQAIVNNEILFNNVIYFFTFLALLVAVIIKTNIKILNKIGSYYSYCEYKSVKFLSNYLNDGMCLLSNVNKTHLIHTFLMITTEKDDLNKKLFMSFLCDIKSLDKYRMNNYVNDVINNPSNKYFELFDKYKD